MWPPATYDVTEVLRDDQRAAIYRGVRSSDRHPVIIKMLGPARRRPRDLDRLRNEYEVVSHLDSPSVVRPIAFGLDAGRSGIVFDDYGGRSLDRSVALPMALERFLELAVRIAGALADIHEKGIVHKDIKPENILVHPNTGEVKLTDFELASLIPRERVDAAVSPQRIEGSLPYMSPEQTGRTRHAVDHRTDLYSLGVTLYQLRSGRLPLEATDPLGWMHCHLAMTPIPLREAAHGTPDIVSDIVAKLLAKEPEDRYASAFGVLHDLRRCLDALRHGSIEAFALGERDTSAEFRIPARLYGRQREVQTLIAAFDRVTASGAPSLVLVGGYAGVGKSALVRELHGSIVRERGLFLTGKFDQYQRGIPYSTIAHAFGAWLRDLMTESEAVIATWRVRLREALGINAGVVVDLIPELSKLVDAPPVASVPLEEAKRRFRLVLPQFLSAFAEKGRPLTLFLDDLQWADPESLGLIEDVLTQPETKYVLIVGAYRDNEVSASHPLSTMLETVRKSGIDLVNLSLGPLSQAHTNELVADALHTSQREAEPLAKLIEQRTAGNPFFTVQLLAALHEGGLLQFDLGAGAFRWDLEQIRTRGFAEDVVELMIERLRALPPATQAALKVAACIGNVFDLRSVALVRERSLEAMQAELWEAVRIGVVLRSETSYRFLHDRIHEAAIALIPAKQRSELHLSIGRMLLAHIPAARRSEHVFEIVSQLNQAASLIHDGAEHTLLAELNLQAATKAQASAAYGAAVRYCAAGIDLLPEDAWQSQRRLAYALHLEHAQSAYLNDSFELAESLLGDLLAHCENVVERAAPCCVGIQLHAARGDLAKAVGLTTEYLRLTGFDLSRTPTREAVEEEHRRVLDAIGERAIEDLVHLPQMTDPEQNALVSVLSVALPATLFVDDKLFALLSCHGVRRTLAHGTSDAAPTFYVAFAMVSGAFFGRYREGYRLGKLALELSSNRNQAAVQASVSMVFGFLLSYWVEPIEEMFPHLERSIRTGVESGNITYACFSAANLVSAKLAAGQPLADVEREAVRQLDFVQRLGFAQEADDILTSMLFIQRMRGHGTLDESAVSDQIAATEVPIYRCLYLIRDIELHVLYRRYPEALAAARRAEPLLWSAPNFMQVADYVLFTALALAQSGVREGLDEHERRLREWATNCPANFAHSAALLAAEIARLDARDSAARELYERAIGAARDRGFTQVEALACELAAEFYATRDRAPLARAYREEARNAYSRWGAEGKVRELERRDRSLAPPLAGASMTFAAGATELNLLSVVKASQTISRELVHGDLASTLLRVVLEQSGAQRGCLVLVRGRSVTVEAVAEARDGSRLLLFPALPVARSDIVPRRLIERVIATRKRVVVEDASADPEAIEGADYLTRFRPRSALCVPILRQARVVGCLYLENSLLRGSFTPERLDVLELLASQAAISLDNAYLLQRALKARKAAEEARERAAFLAEVGSVLSESLDVDVVLEQVARAVVRSLADWIAFDVMENGELKRRVGVHRDPVKAGLIQELTRRYPASRGSPHAANEVMKSRRPMLIAEVTEQFLLEHSVDDEHRRLIRALGSDTGVIVPLQVRDQVIGAVTLGAQGPRRFGPAELELATELARRAALAIDNATLYQEARTAVQEARIAVRQRDEFLSIASHELRTPLTSLLLATQAMRKLWSQGRANLAAFPQTMELVERQGRRLEAQVDDLLDITRMDAGKLRLERADVDLVEITREVLVRFEYDLKQARSAVALEAPSPVRGYWDPSRLAQVVSNLLSNAIKFGRGHPIEISVSAGQGRAQLVVTDHGIGFDPAQQARIFDRYARAASARHFGGLGLGLHICRQIVEAHDGTITGSGAPGVGARFSVELPQRGALTPPD